MAQTSKLRPRITETRHSRGVRAAAAYAVIDCKNNAPAQTRPVEALRALELSIRANDILSTGRIDALAGRCDCPGMMRRPREDRGATGHNTSLRCVFRVLPEIPFESASRSENCHHRVIESR
jgi:hypothetical protein